MINPTPRPLYPRERDCAHSTEGWLDPRDSLGTWEKCLPQRVFDPRTVRPVANSYTDYDVPENGNYYSRTPVFIGKKDSGLVKTGRKLAFKLSLTNGKNLARVAKPLAEKALIFIVLIQIIFVPCSNCWSSLYLLTIQILSRNKSV